MNTEPLIRNLERWAREAQRATSTGPGSSWRKAESKLKEAREALAAELQHLRESNAKLLAGLEYAAAEAEGQHADPLRTLQGIRDHSRAVIDRRFE